MDAASGSRAMSSCLVVLGVINPACVHGAYVGSMIHVRHNVDDVVDIDSFVSEQLGNVYTCDITLSIHCVLCGHITPQGKCNTGQYATYHFCSTALYAVIHTHYLHTVMIIG